MLRYSFDLCRKRNRAKKLTMVDKANAVAAMDLWTRAFEWAGTTLTSGATTRTSMRRACGWSRIRVLRYRGRLQHVRGHPHGSGRGDSGRSGGRRVRQHPSGTGLDVRAHPRIRAQARGKERRVAGGCDSRRRCSSSTWEEAAAVRIGRAVEAVFATGELRSIGTDSGVSTEAQGTMIRERIRTGAATPAR